MKRIIIITIILVCVFLVKADPVIFIRCDPPFDNNYKAILTSAQTSNFWGCVLYDPDLVLPDCHTNQHIQGATILLMDDGRTKINLIWMDDVPTNSNMTVKMKASRPVKNDLFKKISSE